MPSPRRALATLFVIVFTDLIGFGIVIPLLPLYAEHFAPTPVQFGLLMAAYSAMQFLFAPILGRLSDRVGRRPVLLISIAGSIAGFVLFALAHSLAWLFASRLLAGMGGGNIGTAQAVIADVTSREQRAKGMGLIGAAFGLGFIVGPAMAALVLPLGESAPGWAAAGFSVAAWLMTLFFLPETRPAGTAPAGGVLTGFARIRAGLHRPDLAPLLAVGFIVITGFAAFEVTFAQFLHARLGLPHQQVSLLFVYVGVLAAVIQGGLVGRIAPRLGERRMLIAGLACTGLGLLALAGAGRLGSIMAILPLVALGSGLSMPALSALVSHTAGAEEQGLALGAFQGLGSLARVLGPFAAELALGRWGVAAPPLAAAALALAAAVGAGVMLRRRPAAA